MGIGAHQGKLQDVSCGVLAVEFVLIFFHDQAVDEVATLGGEWEVMLGLELLEDEAEHHFLGEGRIGEELGVLGNAGVGFGFEVGEGSGQFALVRGGVAFFHEPLVEAGVFGVVGVFCEEQLVLPL